MRMRKLRHNRDFCLFAILCIVTAVTGGAGLLAQESFPSLSDAALIVRLKNMRRAEAPFAHGSHVIFTYKGGPNTRLVGIAFETEGFSKLNFLVRNAHDVFIYVYVTNFQSPEQNRLAYRYWADGLWHQDPENPAYYLDSQQTPVSLFSARGPRANPLKVEDGYDFYAYFEPGQQVSLLGNFNNWDPFLYPLQEIESGKYHIRIAALRPGNYQYYFWVGGSKRLDSRNYRVGLNIHGEEVSLFTVDAPASR